MKTWGLIAAIALAIGGAAQAQDGAQEETYIANWSEVTAAGGMAVDGVSRDEAGNLLLNVRCDISGVRQITTLPTVLNSKVAINELSASLNGNAIELRMQLRKTRFSTKDSKCTPVPLPNLGPGSYNVLFLGPDDQRQTLGQVEVQ